MENLHVNQNQSWLLIVVYGYNNYNSYCNLHVNKVKVNLMIHIYFRHWAQAPSKECTLLNVKLVKIMMLRNVESVGVTSVLRKQTLSLWSSVMSASLIFISRQLYVIYIDHIYISLYNKVVRLKFMSRIQFRFK